MALTFGRFLDWDFHIGVSATQGHTRVPEQVSEISLGERLSIERCRKLGMIFHATDNANYEGIRESVRGASSWRQLAPRGNGTGWRFTSSTLAG